MTVALRPAGPDDYSHVISRVDDWWGGRAMAAMLPKLFFIHFPDTTRVECVTSPINDGSRAFHAAMGFSERMVDDYDGLGQPRMVLQRDLPRAAPSAGGC